MVKNLPANAGDTGSISGSGRSLGEGNGNPLQYSWMEKPMDRGAWQAIVHRLTRISHNWNDQACMQLDFRWGKIMFWREPWKPPRTWPCMVEELILWNGKIQFSSVAQSCLTLCDPMNFSMPGLPVYHQLPEFTQTHVHQVTLLFKLTQRGSTYSVI